MRLTYTHQGSTHPVEIEPKGAESLVTVGGRTIRVQISRAPDGALLAVVDGRPLRLHYAASGAERYLACGAARLTLTREVGGRKRAREDAAGSLTSPMPGQVLKVHVSPGDTVEAGQTLVVIEAMKMEYEVRAPQAGTVTKVHFAPGAMVTAGVVLVDVEASS